MENSNPQRPRVEATLPHNTGDINNVRAIAGALNPAFTWAVSGSSEEYWKRLLIPESWPDIFFNYDANTGAVIKKASHRRTFTVLMHAPDYGAHMNSRHMVGIDFHIKYAHNRAITDDRTHVYETVPSPITPASLEEARIEWEPELRRKGMQHPVYMLIINKASNISKLADTLRAQIKETGGTLLITTSAKSGQLYPQVVQEHLQGIEPQYLHMYDKESPRNPYQAMLALADKIILPADSLSLPSDVLATGKPAYLYFPDDVPDLPLQEQLAYATRIYQDYLTPLAGKGYFHSTDKLAEDVKQPRPLNSATQIVADIMRKYEKFHAARQANGIPAAPSDAKEITGTIASSPSLIAGK
jgi:hypothetical protein